MSKKKPSAPDIPGYFGAHEMYDVYDFTPVNKYDVFSHVHPDDVLPLVDEQAAIVMAESEAMRQAASLNIRFSEDSVDATTRPNIIDLVDRMPTFSADVPVVLPVLGGSVAIEFVTQ